MKKFFALAVSVCLILFAFCACNETETFQASGFKNYVKLGSYKNITVDASTEEYAEYYKTIHLGNVAKADCYNEADSGTVEYGDIANIDYRGTIDGMAFDGGTAEGYDLTIGSKNFIDGFEDGLIGVEVGQTVDLNLKFPEEYDSQDLAGKDCVFTVKVNSRKVPKSEEECYKDMGYKSVEEYKKSIDDACVEHFAIRQFVKNCTFKSTPDVKNFKAVVFLNYYNALCNESYGMSLEDYLAGNNSNLNKFSEGIVDNLSDNALESPQEIKDVKEAILAYYALFDAEHLSYDEKAVLGESEGYERCYKESLAVKEQSLKALKKYVTVKKTAE